MAVKKTAKKVADKPEVVTSAATPSTPQVHEEKKQLPCDYCENTGLINNAQDLCPKCKGTLVVVDDKYRR